MPACSPIHIVDSDSRRRARIAFTLANGDLRSQVYETPEELGRFPFDSGLVLLSGDDGGASLATLNDVLLPRRHYVPIVMYAREPRIDQVVDAMLAGALDYLAWPFDARDVRTTLAKIEDRVTEAAKAQHRRASAEHLIERLSARESDVLTAMVQGFSNKAIGTNLGISSRTVEIHRANVMRKLGAGSAAEAVRIGLYAGIDEQ